MGQSSSYDTFAAPLTRGLSVTADLLHLTADITAAYLRRHTLPAADLPGLIRTVTDALSSLGATPPDAAEPGPAPKPAVPIRRSVLREHIVCLECGQTLKMLKRHLMADHGLSIDDYRARWQLPNDYPMVAPDYARTRSAMAKANGLGKRPRR